MTISADLLRDYAVAVFRGAGLDEEDARDVADHLVDANLLGNINCGRETTPVRA